jgi:23S rRNA (uracil1939-C5)-methyltransferase
VTLARGARVDLTIDRLAPTGEGVARHDGRVIFVPLTAPGDRVRVEIVRVYTRYARASLLEILEPGPDRVEPPCPYFGRCGGCSWMHLSDEAQRAERVRIVRDALERVGRVPDVPAPSVLPSPRSLGYRSRARVAASHRAVGFRARGSRRVVDVARCLVLDPETGRELERLRARPPRASTEIEVRGFGEKVDVGGTMLRVGRRAFFQPNRALWAGWQSAVADRCGRGRSLVELYAGVGFYTVLLTSRFSHVVAVERSTAARDARANTTAAVVRADATDWAPKNLGVIAPDVVLANPPRTGCHPSVLNAVLDAGPRRFVYVSCDPATLARDVGRLLQHYRVIDLLVIDALPQTHHVEVICVLERRHMDFSTENVLTVSKTDG